MTSEIALNLDGDGDRLMVGLMWDENEEVVFGELMAHDLDLSCAVLTEDFRLVDIITPVEPMREKYRNAIFHSGDHLSGGSDFEDEHVVIQFGQLPADIGVLAIMISSKKPIKIGDTKNAACVFCDGLSLRKIYEADLTEAARDAGDSQPGQFFLTGLLRHAPGGAGWVLKPVNSFLSNTGGDAFAAEIRDMM